MFVKIFIRHRKYLLFLCFDSLIIYLHINRPHTQTQQGSIYPMKLLLVVLITLSPAVFAASPVWLIESGHNRLFLAGTIHLLRASDYPLPSAFESAYRQAQRLSFETDIEETQSPAFQQRLIKAVSLPPNKTLNDLLNPQSLAQLEAYLRDNRLSLQQFSGYKPSMIALSLTLLELNKLGAGQHGVDRYYFDKAIQDGKPTLALESLQQQIDFLTEMGSGQEDLMIQQTLEEIKTMEEQFAHMTDGWRKGDSQQLESLFIEPMRQQFEPMYQQLLVQRNLNWLPQIQQYLSTAETEMVLVGSAHLLGVDGLISLLTKAGYKITQLD